VEIEIVNAWIIDPTAPIDGREAGGKGRALAQALASGLAVPPWTVVPPCAFTQDGALRPEAVEELLKAIEWLAPSGERLAVRSSAVDEDGATHSFAGQLDSFLNVSAADVVCRVHEVYRSAFADRVVAYSCERGLPLAQRPPAVLVQRMVRARASGVAFSADPVSGRSGVAVVSAVRGLADSLVSGHTAGDTWHVDRLGNIVARHCTIADRPVLTDDEIVSVAALARSAARVFGRPQDIEWAFDDRLWLLQSRPITSLASLPDPDGRLTLWDNSNVVESYSGVTTPLTFSFASDIYRYVYRQFCRMMRVPERTIAAHDATFETLLGLIRGRLYYNLPSWYRMLAMLPGYRVNRRFMDQMMGVKEPLPVAIAAEIESETRRGRLLDAAYAARTAAGLLLNHFTLDRRVREFYARLDRALAPPDPPLEDRRIDELVAHYRELRQQLLLRWDAPLVNDFFVMVFYGLLRSLTVRWCADPGGTLQNDLIVGAGGVVSAEPAVRMQRLARLAAGDTAFVALLARGSRRQIEDAFAARQDFASEVRVYVAKFGDRTINELKLESETLNDDPLQLFRAVARLAEASPSREPIGPEGEAFSPADQRRAESRRHVAAALARHPLRRWLFTWVLRHAQRRVRDRENLRLERTRVFGRVRRIFLEIGRRLHAAGVLDDPRGVFYLELDEVLAYAEGRATTVSLNALAALRRREFDVYAKDAPPAERFETRGAVYHANDFRETAQAAAPDGDVVTGLGCSPGVVRGRVRVVTDPTAIDLEPGTILVAEHTDPGWIMVFPSARGILVERGSLLSHAAIVARELGIPAVVSLPGVTRWLSDGDWIEMDGSAGTIRRIQVSEAACA
jgi:rifampicin phosphotransferase